jgi:hypothetical protein
MGQEVPGLWRTGFFFLKCQRKETVITPEKKLEIQQHYQSGEDLSTISTLLHIKHDTVLKAIKTGRLLLPERLNEQAGYLTKSERTIIDNEQAMGKACTNTLERVMAGKSGTACPISFTNQIDLHQSGVLLALPSLLAHGLLKYQSDFEHVSGYYSSNSIFIALAFLALLRVKTLSQVADIPSGELGKAIGLDRIPEVKTLRERIANFCKATDVELWSRNLSQDWMGQYPELSGVLYIDGHVKIYHGQETNLPKRFVSRLRLCMSGTTDYWVNDKMGQPFFVINKAISEGLIATIYDEVLPRLEHDIPNQPTANELASDAHLHKYMLVVDREGYSPDFFYDLWQQRVAICTYNKNVKDQWPSDEFTTHTGSLTSDAEQTIELAERCVLLQNKTSDKKIWVREIRKKSQSGHQTSIITTNFKLSTILIGLHMFARWSQENFFKYMMENYGIDSLTSYLKETISDTTVLVNPAYRDLEAQRKKETSKLNLQKIKFATLNLNNTPIEEIKMKAYLTQKQEITSEIERLQLIIEEIKEKKKGIARKITFAELPQSEKFNKVTNKRKHFLDTIKILAYRSETAMSNIIKPYMSHPDESRLLLKQIYQSDANIKVDHQNQILTVELHNLTYWKDDKIIRNLCNTLNETQTKFPDTNLSIVYKLVTT